MTANQIANNAQAEQNRHNKQDEALKAQQNKNQLITGSAQALSRPISSLIGAANDPS